MLWLNTTTHLHVHALLRIKLYKQLRSQGFVEYPHLISLLVSLGKYAQLRQQVDNLLVYASMVGVQQLAQEGDGLRRLFQGVVELGEGVMVRTR